MNLWNLALLFRGRAREALEKCQSHGRRGDKAVMLCIAVQVIMNNDNKLGKIHILGDAELDGRCRAERGCQIMIINKTLNITGAPIDHFFVFAAAIFKQLFSCQGFGLNGRYHKKKSENCNKKCISHDIKRYKSIWRFWQCFFKR